MHVERQEITFVQRPNTSAHVPPCWKISLHHFHICRLVWSYIWQVDMSTLPHKLILAQKSKCYLTSHCTAAGFLAFCPPFFPPDSFTPETPKRSSASCSCFTPFTKPLNDCRWRIPHWSRREWSCPQVVSHKILLLEDSGPTTLSVAEHWHRLEAESTLAASLPRNWEYVSLPGLVWSNVRPVY